MRRKGIEEAVTRRSVSTYRALSKRLRGRNAAVTKTYPGVSIE